MTRREILYKYVRSLSPFYESQINSLDSFEKCCSDFYAERVANVFKIYHSKMHNLLEDVQNKDLSFTERRKIFKSFWCALFFIKINMVLVFFSSLINCDFFQFLKTN